MAPRTITVCTGKLHRVRVTGAELGYTGSVTIGPELMSAVGIRPFQLVHINGVEGAHHWETYAIPGDPGELTLNGPPARLFRPGDHVIVLALEHVEPKDLEEMLHRTALVDDENRITDVLVKDMGW